MIGAVTATSRRSRVTGATRCLPAIFGHEAAGVVVEVGGGVAEVLLADHVVVTLVRSCGRWGVEIDPGWLKASTHRSSGIAEAGYAPLRRGHRAP
jgi:threonine dehydrogenase-like Zn-dependent dehydrogenase